MATKAQTNHLDVLCNEVRAMNAKRDVLCSHMAYLGDTEHDIATIANGVKGVENKTDVVSSFVSSLKERVEDIGVSIGHKADETRKAEEERRLAEPKEQEERRNAEETGRLKEEREERRKAEEAARLAAQRKAEERRRADEALRISFCRKDLETVTQGVETLKRWTGLSTATAFFDSTADEFTLDGLFNKVKGKKNVAVIGFTTDGDVFGGFYSRAVTKQATCFYDPNIFVFSFESHGRCMTPQRFDVKDGLKQRPFVYFDKNNTYGFVWFSVDCAGGFWLGNEKSNSCCENQPKGFEETEDTTLTGYNRRCHQCTRLVAIHLS